MFAEPYCEVDQSFFSKARFVAAFFRAGLSEKSCEKCERDECSLFKIVPANKGCGHPEIICLFCCLEIRNKGFEIFVPGRIVTFWNQEIAREQKRAPNERIPNAVFLANLAKLKPGCPSL